jgi:hypothetical protein
MELLTFLLAKTAEESFFQKAGENLQNEIKET